MTAPATVPNPAVKAAPKAGAPAKTPPPLSPVKEAAPLKLQEPVAIVVKAMPAEKPDITGDLVSGGIGVFGAIVGAAFAAFLTRRDRNKEERIKDDQAMSEVTRKLVRIYSVALDTVTDHAKAVAKKAEINSPALTPVYQPAANDPDDVTFTADEYYRARKVSGDTLANRLTDAAGDYGAITKSLLVYKGRWLAFGEKYNPVDAADGKATFEFTAEQLPAVVAELGASDGLLNSINELASDLVKDARTALFEALEADCKYFKRKRKLDLREPTGEVKTYEFGVKKGP